MTLTPKPNAAAVRAYRDEHGCGIQEAKAATFEHWKLKNMCRLRKEASGPLAELIDLLIEDLVT